MEWLGRHKWTIAFVLLGALLSVLALRLGEERIAQRIALENERRRMALPDTLRVATLSGATTYFTIQDEEMGYQYELLRLYSESSGMPIKLQVAPSLDSLHTLLATSQVHLSITPEAVTKEAQQMWRFTGPSIERAMVLVQRKPKNKDDSTYVHNVTELIGRPLYVLADSHYEQRLHNLGEQLGQELDIRYLSSETRSAEDLIAQVATDSIDYAIVDSELAHLAHTYYPNIDYKLSVGFAQRLRWLSSSEYEGLAQSIDRWALLAPQQPKARYIYKKYFELYKVPIAEEKRQDALDAQITQIIPKGHISPYDNLFRSMASGLSFSWHLLAAIAYQESRFRADIVGWSGARGLMGIMPATGRAYGASIQDLLHPQESVRVALRCLADTERAFSKIESTEERLRFTLAGYNSGIGHIQDAQRLAKKYGDNPHLWADVQKYILLKSERKYYTDPVCRHGYLRGKETYRYAQEVYRRYKEYIQRKQ